MESHLWCLYGQGCLTCLLMMSQEEFQGGFSVQIHGLLGHTQIGRLSRWILWFVKDLLKHLSSICFTNSCLLSCAGYVECSSIIYNWSIYSSNYDCCALLLRPQCCISTCPTEGVQSEETSFISLWPSSFGFPGKLFRWNIGFSLVIISRGSIP